MSNLEAIWRSYTLDWTLVLQNKVTASAPYWAASRTSVEFFLESSNHVFCNDLDLFVRKGLDFLISKVGGISIVQPDISQLPASDKMIYRNPNLVVQC